MAYKVPKLQPDDRLPRKYTPAGVEDDLASLDSRAGDLENTVENGRLSGAALTDEIVRVIGETVPPIPPGVVTSIDVSRIVAAVEGAPQPPLEEGDLLLRVKQPGTVYYRDFADDTADDPPAVTPPADMTKLLAASLNVRPFSTGQNAKVLTSPSSGTAAYSLDAADEDPYLGHAEFLVRWHYISTGSGGHGLGIFFNVDAGTDSYYRISYNRVSGQGRLRWTIRRNGANVNTPEVDVPTLEAGTWCLMRARMAGGVISGKLWEEGDPEPTEWQYTRAVDDFLPVLPSGPHGVGAVDTYLHIDRIALATGGKTAEFPA